MSEASPFSKKTVYHSQLVAEGQMEILVNSDVTKSKFKKDYEDQFFIDFKYKGKPQQYIIENESIQKKLHGLKGHVVSITATGSRDDADMEIFDAAGPASTATQQHRQEQPPPASGAPPSGNVHPVTAAKRLMMQHINASLLAREAANMVGMEWDARHPTLIMSESDFERTVSNFYIGLDRSGLIATLPYEIIPPKSATKAAPPPKKAEPPPKPKPEPPPLEDDSDDIPF